MDCWSFLQVVATVVLAILGILIPIAGMFMWNRAEANADRAEANADRREAAAERKDMANKLDAKIELNVKDTREIIESNMAQTRTMIESNMRETREMINAIKEEAKDFHARLCVIESNRRIIINKDGQPLG